MKLLEHAVIAGMPVRNRILRSATWEALADAKGYMSEKQYRIYDQLAKNEVGLICTGYARVDGEDRPNAGMMGIYDDAFIPQYQELTRRVHAYGSKIMMQIAYGGTKTTFEREGRTIFSPSAVPERKTGTVGVAMSPDDIRHLIDELPRLPSASATAASMPLKSTAAIRTCSTSSSVPIIIGAAMPMAVRRPTVTASSAISLPPSARP